MPIFSTSYFRVMLWFACVASPQTVKSSLRISYYSELISSSQPVLWTRPVPIFLFLFQAQTHSKLSTSHLASFLVSLLLLLLCISLIPNFFFLLPMTKFRVFFKTCHIPTCCFLWIITFWNELVHVFSYMVMSSHPPSPPDPPWLLGTWQQKLGSE